MWQKNISENLVRIISNPAIKQKHYSLYSFLWLMFKNHYFLYGLCPENTVNIQKNGRIEKIGGSQNFWSNINNPEKRYNSSQTSIFKKTGESKSDAPPPK